MKHREVHLAGDVAPQPGHICAFFDSDAEKYRTLGPYFSEAIANGDLVLNVVDSDRVTPHLHALQHAHVPVEKAMRQNCLSVRATEDVYMRDGKLELDEVLAMLKTATASSMREGRNFRTCGEMNWIARHPEALGQAMEYEAKVNDLLTDNCTMMCVYDTAVMPSGLMADILTTHPYAIINGKLRKNDHYIPPAEYLAMRREQRH